MLKLKVSYENKEELIQLLHVLRPHMGKMKQSKNQEGKYKKAYIELKEKGAIKRKT